MTAKEYLAWAHSLIPVLKGERQKIEVFIHWAAGPLIAGIKPAALVLIPGSYGLAGIWKDTGTALCLGWDISALPLREGKGGILVLLYRRRQLAKRITTGAAARYLSSLAYPAGQGLEACLEHLKNHFNNMERTKLFPHEIGIFLGYPLGDVIGFCSDRYCTGGSLCCGYWKVYHRPEKAKRTFARMDAARIALVQNTLKNNKFRNNEGQAHLSPWTALR